MRSSDQRVLLAIAEAAAPAGNYIPEVDESVAGAVEQVVIETTGESGFKQYVRCMRALDLASIAVSGSRLSKLKFLERERALRDLEQSTATGWMVRIVTLPIKLARFRSPRLAEHLGLKRTNDSGLVMAHEHKRWEERIVDARELETDEELEVDVVVVGTGAGGAPVAATLAKKGHAVVMIEEGGYFPRTEFARPLTQLQRKLFRNAGLTGTLGNTVIPVPFGKTVGGTTTVNSGTCYRVPSAVQRRWELEEGLRDLRPGTLDGYFDRVETMLEVAPAEDRHLGGSARMIQRGCEALGYEHAPLHRNAPGCDGQALCCYGCPTDAKRSTNISYVPDALEHGAMVYTHAQVTRVLTSNGRAVGVSARVRKQDGRTVRLTIRACKVVLACGAMHTPGLLLSNGLANSSGNVGRGLTIHPTGYAWAMSETPVRGWEGIPQGYAIEEFAEQGIRFEGAFLPPELAVASVNRTGRHWTDVVERFDHVAIFGFMLADKSRGRVELGMNGEPRMRYSLNEEDRMRMLRAQAILARVFFAAGARVVFPGMQFFDELRSEADVRRMEREAPSRVRPHHMDISAYHPLGSCRMGADPKRFVVGPDHQTFDVEDLYVCDGSAVPGPLGVNPQMTIMAFSERAADVIAERLDTRGAVDVPAQIRIEPELEFKETMSGSCRTADGEDRTQSLVFHVAASAAELGDALSTGGTLALSGELYLEGVASHVPCRGTLLIRPLSMRSTLTYELHFEDDRGRELLLHGEKHVSPTDPVNGMTTLYTEVRTPSGEVLTQGILKFDLRDLGPWLRSFRYSKQTA